MVTSAARTVAAYLDALPPDRRALIARVRDLVNAHLPAGYVEVMNWGMIAWEIPLARYPVTYNGRPLMYAALAAQARHCALYLMGSYGDPARRAALEGAYRAAGKRLNMGGSCLRFRAWEELVPEAIAAVIAAVDVEGYIAAYERSRGTGGAARHAGARKTTTTKAATRKTATRKTATKTTTARTTAAKTTAAKTRTAKTRTAKKVTARKTTAARKLPARTPSATKRGAPRSTGRATRTARPDR